MTTSPTGPLTVICYYENVTSVEADVTSCRIVDDGKGRLLVDAGGAKILANRCQVLLDGQQLEDVQARPADIL